MILTRDEVIMLRKLQRLTEENECTAVDARHAVGEVPKHLKEARDAVCRNSVLALAAAGMIVIEDWDKLLVSVTDIGNVIV